MHNLNQQKLVMIVVMKSYEEQLSDQMMNMEYKEEIWKME